MVHSINVSFYGSIICIAELIYLEARQVGVAQLHLVLVQEVLGDGALDRLAILELQRERLHLRRTARHVAHAVLAPHRTAVSDLNLQTCSAIIKRFH